jgi:catechol 2,3-dioxygenase-like lactoylglutathione lyase family enzyme
LFEVVESDEWFGPAAYGGGVGGAVLGVSDMDASLKLYRDVLGYDKVVLDQTGTHDAFAPLPGGEQAYRRLVLRRSEPTAGPFSQLLGGGEIELVQALDRAPRNLFEGRYWGDLGFIHLCWDVRDMDALGQELEAAGFPFTVNSASSFDMGEASGQFTYVEDPDGTWIEFVETHKIPISQKLNWYLDTRKRPAAKPLPKWMLKMLRFNRVKD